MSQAEESVGRLPRSLGTAGIKNSVKEFVQRYPYFWSLYWRLKQQVRRIWLLRYFLYDIANAYRAMFWGQAQSDGRALSSELLFQFHKLEKGMSMPGPKRSFGHEPSLRVAELLLRWRELGLSKNDPVYVGAIQTLLSYRERIANVCSGADTGRIDSVLGICTERDNRLITPVGLPDCEPLEDENNRAVVMKMALQRRSVRMFRDEPVPFEAIEFATKIAQLSPSACNRQPNIVYTVAGREKIDAFLSLQNGNRGFGHLAQMLAVIASDEKCFFDVSERHEPFIDGGLFSMSFLYGLQAAGLASCCLNWCVSPEVDRKAHTRFRIPHSHRIMMLVAIGYPQEQCVVPRSARRDISEVLVSLS